MSNIAIYDCTLGCIGNIDECIFENTAINDILHKLILSRADVIEVGMLKDEPYFDGKPVYNVIPRKKPLGETNVQFSVCVDISDNPFPAERITLRCDSTVDIIRVMFMKYDINEAYEFCKVVTEKGYELYIHPLCIDHYSNDELTHLMNLFCQLNPKAFYISDDWGTQEQSALLSLFRLADQHLKKDICLGYNGHNNRMQALDVAKAFALLDINRKKIINASVSGISRGAGMINYELIADYVNKIEKNRYILRPVYDVYAHYLGRIYDNHSWGYRIPLYLSAKYGCNPQYLYYYEDKLKLCIDEVSSVLQSISSRDKTCFSVKKAKEYLVKYRRSFWSGKLCVVFPTANRADYISWCLKTTAKKFMECGIDVIIYDSSTNHDTKKIVQKYIDNGFWNIKYDYYVGELSDSIDAKLISLYQKYSDLYEYIWPCRDGYIIKIENIYNEIYRLYSKHYDMLIAYSLYQLEKDYAINPYTDAFRLFKDCCCHMTILGTVIVASAFIKKVIEIVPLDSIKNYAMWQPIAIFEYIADHSFRAHLLIGDIFTNNYYATVVSFWNKNGKALWQWGERWYEMINRLPEVYDNAKKEVMQVQMVDFHPFEIPQLVIMRANGSLKLRYVLKYAKYLKHTSYVSLSKIYAVSIFPKFICRSVFLHPDSFFAKSIKACYRLAKKFYRALKRSSNNTALYDLQAFEFSKNERNKHIRFQNGQLCIVIPTANKASLIGDVLLKVLSLYDDYGVDVFIYDSSSNSETESVVNVHIKNGAKNLYYINCSEYSSEKTIDKKCIRAYLECSSKYEYVWMIRDRLLVNLNNIGFKLKQLLSKNPDIISIHNPEEDYYHVGFKEYDDPVEFFKEQFVPMTVLGNLIVRSTAIRKIINEFPLDPVSNYGLWQPVAFFSYFASNQIYAVSFSDKVFSYHPLETEGSFWRNQLCWQWIDRWYDILANLPEIYNDFLPDVLQQHLNRYHILHGHYVLGSKLCGGLKYRDVKSCSSKIPYLTNIPVKSFYFFALMPRCIAKIMYNNTNNILWRRLFKEYDNKLLGKIKPVSQRVNDTFYTDNYLAK